MGQVLDFNAASNGLKQRYESDPIITAYIKEHIALADVMKDEKAGGAAFNIAIKYAIMSTRGVTVPIALANGSPDQYGKWNIPELYSDYAVMQVSGQALDAAMGDENAMMDLAKETLDGGYLSAYESQANAMFGNGGGSRGQLNGSTTVNTTVVTIGGTTGDTSQALRFWPGQVVQASADDGTGGAGVRSGSVTLFGVDQIAGTLTATGNWNSGIAAITNADFLFAFGDYNAVFVGYAGWLPAPSVSTGASLYTSFFGQNRTAQRAALAGWNYAGGGASYEDTIAQLTAYVTQFGGNPTRCYVNPLDFIQIAKQQSSKVIYDRATVQAFANPKLQFKGLSFMHSKGEMQIVADAYCPIGHFYVIQPDTWKLYSMGKICRPANNWIGQMWLPSQTDDVVQARIVTRSFLGSRSPGYNGHGTF